jgi:cysteine desulfuration protein SufE
MAWAASFVGCWAAPEICCAGVTIEEKQQNLAAALSGFGSGQDRLAYIVGRGRAAPRLEAEFRTDAFRVQGCLAAVWFVGQFGEGRGHFQADSDSAVVKGIAVLLCEFYSGQTPEEIVRVKPDFLAAFGVTQHLTPNRRNGLGKIWESIRSCAQAHLES